MSGAFASQLLQQDDEPDVGLMPLIDVVFQLLVFFMLTSTFASPALELNLPRLSGDTNPAEPLAWKVDMRADGTTLLENEPLASLQPEALQALFTSDPERQSVAIRADAQAPHGQVLELLQALGDAGMAQVHFVYEANESATRASAELGSKPALNPNSLP